MKPEPGQPKARQFIESLAAAGRYNFDSAEAQAALGDTAAKFALSRLAKQGTIASPARGFYVIVPPDCVALIFEIGGGFSQEYRFFLTVLKSRHRRQRFPLQYLQ